MTSVPLRPGIMQSLVRALCRSYATGCADSDPRPATYQGAVAGQVCKQKSREPRDSVDAVKMTPGRLSPSTMTVRSVGILNCE